MIYAPWVKLFEEEEAGGGGGEEGRGGGRSRQKSLADNLLLVLHA